MLPIFIYIMDKCMACSDIRKNENTQQGNGLSPYKARYSHCKIKGIALTHWLRILKV